MASIRLLRALFMMLSGGGSGRGVNGILCFHGLQVDQVCKQDAFGDFAALRDNF